MTEMEELRVTIIAAAISIQNHLLRWRRDHALPLRDRYGVDRRSGGVFENVSCCMRELKFEVSADVRRGRVVAG